MARSAIILGRKHGSQTMEVVSGPEVPMHEQLAKFKEMVASRSHQKWGYVELAMTEKERSSFLQPEPKSVSKPEQNKKSQNEKVQ